MASGLIVGKFYPPHRGHSFLIDSARARVEQLTVVVCERADQTIPGALRASWLRETHPDVDVRVVRDIEADDDSAAWAAYMIEILGGGPDVVFTSEPYGDAFAAALRCEHVSVDGRRLHVPCSGREIRNDPLSHLDDLQPCVRAHFVRRVAIVGAESTGKTTLCARLAEHFRTSWVPEYGREYWMRKAARMEPWRPADFVHIACEQRRREDEAARTANRVLICDTDSFATAIWAERYLGAAPAAWPVLPSLIALYLVSNVDAPFVQDGTRDGESIRGWMHARFLERLQAHHSNHIVVSGDYEERFAASVSAIAQIAGTVRGAPLGRG